MPAQESAVMNTEVTGQATARPTTAPKKKAKVDTSAIRAQIKEEREGLKTFKNALKFAKDDLRDTLKTGKANVSEAAKHLKAIVSVHTKATKADEKTVTACEKAIAKQQTVIDKLTAKLG